MKLATREADQPAWVAVLFVINLAATLAHYVDNVRALKAYPDLPTTQSSDIIAFEVIVNAVGMLGMYLYYRRGSTRALYLIEVYCLLNLSILGHFLPSRHHGGPGAYAFRIHFFIWLPAVTTVALLAYVILVQLSKVRRSRRSARP